MLDVVPISMGIETVGGVVKHILERGTMIPAKKSQVFTTYQDQQTVVGINIFEGERPMTKNLHKLGHFDLSGIPPAPKGVPQIEVTFEIDENSILTVSAIEKGTGQKQQVTITNEKGRLTASEIEAMINEAKTMEEEDKAMKNLIDSRNQFENYIYQMRRSIEDKDKLADKIEEEDKSTISEALTDAQDWFNAN